MRGSDHYREAERLLEQARRLRNDNPDSADRCIAEAHVHAELAKVAVDVVNGGPVLGGWHDVFMAGNENSD